MFESQRREDAGEKGDTMKCYICNKTLEDEDTHFNTDHKDYDPCPSCLAVVEDTLAGFKDQAAPESVDFDPVIEGLFPTSYDPFGTEVES